MVRFETRGVCDVCIGALHQKIHVGGFPRPLNVQYAEGEAGAPRMNPSTAALLERYRVATRAAPP